MAFVLAIIHRTIIWRLRSWSSSTCVPSHLGRDQTRCLWRRAVLKDNWLGRLSVQFSDTRLRLKAPANVQPNEGRTRREIVAAFHAYQVQCIDRLWQANGVDLARARLSMPLSGWIWIPLGSAFALMVAHARRHIWRRRSE